MNNNIKQKLLKKSLMSRMLYNLRKFLIICRQTALLPIPLYMILEIFRLLQSSMCLLLTDMNKIWDENVPVKNIFKFLQVFWRFSSNSISHSDLRNSFIAILLFYFVIHVPLIVFFAIFQIKGKLSISMCFVTCLFLEIVLPLLNSWVISQSASVLSFCITEEDYRTIFLYIQIIIYIILLCYYFFYEFYFSNNDIAYMRGRSFAWSYQTQLSIILFSSGILFTSRLIETLPKYGSIVFTVISGVLSLLYIISLFITAPFISMNTNSYYIALMISCFFGFIMQNISIHFYYIDIAIVITAVAILAIILHFVFYQLYAKRYQKSISTLDLLASGDISFDEAFKNPNHFLFITRYGFQNGHAFLMSWQPFIAAIEFWPRVKKIWIQWIRFIAIYSEQNRRLEQILTEMNSHSFKDISTKYTILQIKMIRNSRNRHMTKKLKQNLKTMDEKILIIKNMISAYWKDIEEASSNSTYNIARKICQMKNTIQMEYLQMIALWPNNYTIALTYAYFIDNIVSDPLEAQQWKKRAKILKEKNQIINDSTQDFGFECFPFIPHSIFDAQSNITDSNTIIDAHSLSTDNQSTNKDETSNDNDFLEKDIDSTPSHIYKLGQSANLQFITIMLVMILIFFVITFFLAPFAPPTIAMITLKNYREQFESLKSVSNIHVELSKVSFYIIYKALETEKLYPERSDLGDLIEITTNEIILLNQDINFIQSCFGDSISLHSISGDYIKRVSLQLVLKDNHTYSATFFEALNAMAAASFKFTLNHNTSFLHTDWISFYFSNTDQLHKTISEISILLCNDMNKNRDEKVSYIYIVLYFIIALEILSIPLFIHFILYIKSNWNYIIDTINSIPRVAFQKAISKYTAKEKSDNGTINNNESRYQSLFVQMVSSRDTSGGIPVKSIFFVYIFNLIVSFICIIAIILVVGILKKNLSSIPILYFNAADLSYIIYHYMAVFFMKGAVDYKTLYFDSKFAIYDRIAIKELVESIYGKMSKKINTFLFGADDDYKSGSLSASHSMANALLESKGDPFSPDLEESEQWRLFPNLMGVEILNQMNMKMQKRIMSSASYSISSDLSEAWTIYDLAIGVIIPTLIDKILYESSDLFYDKMSNTYMLLYIVGAVLFIVGILSITWFLIILFQVKETVKFVLSSLSMIDTKYVQEMQNVMNLFYGKTHGSVPLNQNLQKAYAEVESLIPENSIELNNHLQIVNIDKRLIEEWKLDSEHVLGNNLDSLIEFENVSILKELYSQALGQDKLNKIHNYYSKATIQSINLNRNMVFTSIYVPGDRETKLIIIIGNSSGSFVMKKMVEELQNANDAIKYEFIPSKIHSKFDFNAKKNRFTSNYVIFAAFEILNIDNNIEFDVKQKREYFKSFVKKIKELCTSEKNDAVLAKVTGSTIIVCMNMIRQNPNYYKPAILTYEFIKDVFHFSKSNGYQIRVSAITSKSLVTILTSKETLKFDMYSKSIQPLLSMLHHAQKDQILFPPKMKDYLPTEIALKAEEFEIVNHNKESEWIFMLKNE
ncbi:hypothetical protein TRFO_19047 [Tritrichomonas foetus]|uniref:TmcB/TmcC TPR repeats domain-containing protein n=1 Tax=Tritrichomonas foetus TaxID=1144522 RepID=A0A1J4KKP3_9EUKA|nr:hypothetical protein TRFO_19047 [Tritrichomonas foetus]|eukprot:OHT11504.1 hypothetical protein TRFO_19047 [Tritrichomonas foetus]